MHDPHHDPWGLPDAVGAHRLAMNAFFTRTARRVVDVSDYARIAQAIQRYLRSGEHEPDHPEWPGQNFLEKATREHDDMLGALVQEVRRRAGGPSHASLPANQELVSWTRTHPTTPFVDDAGRHSLPG